MNRLLQRLAESRERSAAVSQTIRSICNALRLTHRAQPRSAVVLLALQLWSSALAGEANAPAPTPAAADRIAALVRQQIAQRRIPGMAVAVVTNGGVALVQTFGHADLENDVPVTRQTVFRFASVSKPITAVAVMQLVEAGRLSLDATLPSLGMEVPAHLTGITVRQLLAHQSGLRHYQPRATLEPLRHFTTLTEAFAAYSADPLAFEPGTRFSYSTCGYVVLGCALESAAESSFLDQMRARVFLPAGMTNARADHLYEIIPHRAQGYFLSRNGQWRNSEPADNSGKIPGGGLVGTIDDLAAFAAALQNDKLLSAPTRELMWTPQKLADGTVTDYALGWHVGAHNGHREVYHSGSQARTSSFLYLQPENRVAVVVLSNIEQLDFLSLARKIADASAQK
jgi:CubicO group peptidase (beta-lactamase class C family)